MKRAIIKSTVFICLVLSVLLVTSEVFRPKHLEPPNDTTIKTDGFYALDEDSLDVLFLGSSNAYYGFNPGVIYRETGLNSYVFAGECQSIETTYYFLREALKTQHPEIVVLDSFGIIPEVDEYNNSNVIQRNIENLNLSVNKVEAYIDLLDKPLGIFDIITYHNRIDELQSYEILYPFQKHFDSNFGYTLGYPSTDELSDPPLLSVSDYEIPELKLEYLDRIRELLDSEGIELILVKTPIMLDDDNYTALRELGDYCDVNDIPFLDFNELDIDYLRNRDGDVWHANVRGAYKISSYLGEYLDENYSLKRSSEGYAGLYNELYVRTERIILKSEADYYRYFDFLRHEDVTYFISYQTGESFHLDEASLGHLNDLGLDLDGYANDYNFVLICTNEKVLYDRRDNEDFEYLYTGNGYKVSISQENGYVDVSYNDGGPNAKFVGVNISVIDNVTGEKLSDVTLDTSGYVQLLRDES